MKYWDGQEVYIGDKATVDEENGVVVCVIDTQQFSETYNDGWSYLERESLIEATGFGLVHYQEPDEGLILVQRVNNFTT